MQKINIIQFMPYFPPNKWGLETVWEEIWKYWVKNNFWKFINVVTHFYQIPLLISPQGREIEQIIFEWKVIWYKKDWYEVLVCPSIEIINNFPVYKIWSKEYKLIIQYLNGNILNNDFRIFTHTRFFLTSLTWWLFARSNNIEWIHIEHGSDYVKLSSKFFSYLSIIYDKIFWKLIFKKADKIIAISEGVKNFINKEFINRDIKIIYNWIHFQSWKKIDNWNIIRIWFVWRLVKLKWVYLLLKSFKKLSEKYSNLELSIVWDWDEKEILEKYISKNNLKNINLLWLQNRDYIANIFLPSIDILVNPSFQEWLPTTVLEWLLSKCIVVATDVWWTKEISNKEDLIIIKKGSVTELEIVIEKAFLNYKDNIWKSYEHVKNNFDWNSNILKYYDFCKK